MTTASLGAAEQEYKGQGHNCSGDLGPKVMGHGKARTKDSVGSFTAACCFNYFHFDDNDNADKPNIIQKYQVEH